MFAVIQTGGKQYRVEKGTKLDIEKLEAKVGENFELGQVVFLSDNDQVKIGTPIVEGAAVMAKVIDQIKGDKVIIYKMKAKKRYQKKTGHRQFLTTVEITDIKATGAKGAKANAKTEEGETAEKAPVKKAVQKTAAKKTVEKAPKKTVKKAKQE